MDRQAKKLQTVRDEGRFGEESFPEASDEEEEDKEVRDIFIGERLYVYYLYCIGTYLLSNLDICIYMEYMRTEEIYSVLTAYK